MHTNNIIECYLRRPLYVFDDSMTLWHNKKGPLSCNQLLLKLRSMHFPYNLWDILLTCAAVYDDGITTNTYSDLA